MSVADIEKYRNSFEPEEHWELKRKFILAYSDRFPEDRLLCLTQAFANIALLGCRYPNKIMKEITRLATGIGVDFLEMRRGKVKRMFVCASAAAEQKVKKRKPDYGHQHIVSTEEKWEEDEGERIGAESANNSLTKCHVFKKFVLVVRLFGTTQPRHLLLDSCSISKVQYDEKIFFSCGKMSCNIYFDGVCVGKGSGIGKKEAVFDAAENAIRLISKQCYVLVIKKKHDDTGEVTTLDEMLQDQVKSGSKTVSSMDESISDTNVGHRLLQLMGWTGGGLGKNKTGIIEPVKSSGTHGRTGLGMLAQLGDKGAFRRNITELLKKHRAGEEDDLVFTSEFSKNQRELIHKIARSVGLRSRSFGSGDQRYITVSKHYSVETILSKLLTTGMMNTEKHQLFPPGTYIYK